MALAKTAKKSPAKLARKAAADTTTKKPAKAAKAPTNSAGQAVKLKDGEYQGYCVKCKEKGVVFKGNVEVTKTGMNIAKGPCPTCGTTICRIMGKASA